MDQQPKKSFFRRFWWVLLLIILISCAGLFILSKYKPDKSSPTNVLEKFTKEEKVVFTHKLFDPSKVSHILPLGELNGGYVETQTINGVLINNKKDANGNAELVEIYAPADMTLVDYAYAPDPLNPSKPIQWHLGFRVSSDIKLSFDHISSVIDEIKQVTPQTQNSGFVPPTKKLSFKAGDLIAKTSGTDLAHNWNIYLRDENRTNTFVNQERYEKVKQGYDYVNAACPFDFYEENLKQEFLALMGYYKPGQSKTCGSNSRDVKGSISGLWHLTKDGVREDYQDQYATPFSIYKTSANEIVLYEINRKRHILGDKNSTFKDPAEVTDSHCYNLTEYGEDRSTKGYAYFRVDSSTEMSVAYSSTGSCPNAFPEINSKKYYR